MRIPCLPAWVLAIPILILFLSLPQPALGPPLGDEPLSGIDPCLVSPDYVAIASTGTFGQGCRDGWGSYSFMPDAGGRPWGIATECSIAADWESFLGKRVYLEGGTVVVHGGIGGFPGEALGVSRIELATPVLETSWGRIRTLYR